MANKILTGKELAENGLRIAVNNANREFPGWQERCWALFERWIGKKESGFVFQCEDFRQDVYKWNMLEKPKSERAYGFAPKKAEKLGLIEFIKNDKVSNSKAHATPAGVWRKK